MSEPMRCPCCDNPLHIPPHKIREPWTDEQIAWMQSMQGVLSHKTLGRLMGVSPFAIKKILSLVRWGRR